MENIKKINLPAELTAAPISAEQQKQIEALVSHFMQTGDPTLIKTQMTRDNNFKTRLLTEVYKTADTHSDTFNDASKKEIWYHAEKEIRLVTDEYFIVRKVFEIFSDDMIEMVNQNPSADLVYWTARGLDMIDEVTAAKRLFKKLAVTFKHADSAWQLVRIYDTPHRLSRSVHTPDKTRREKYSKLHRQLRGWEEPEIKKAA